MDKEFTVDPEGLHQAVELMSRDFSSAEGFSLPIELPQVGMGSTVALNSLAPSILGGAARLGEATSFAHMDPPTPWITWAITLWNASLNQNLLHPATAPVARQMEKRVVAWLAPFFGMNGGHMTPGSTVANLTALWSARECAGVTQVIASEGAHLSIAKAAHILGLKYLSVPIDANGSMDAMQLPTNLSKSALVLTAGATSTGAIDPFVLAGRAAWTHVDAAWAGPLRLSKHTHLLAGIESADSVAISAHKWLFQPKESALVLFKDTEKAHAAVSFGGAYLATPNVGVLGSHGATATVLLATLLAWGHQGVAQRIEHCMNLARSLSDFVASDERLELYAEPQTGIVVWRPKVENSFDQMQQQLPVGSTSTTSIAGGKWFRNVAANPSADIDLLIATIQGVLAERA
ncbi:pyridoxal-dependent decarboxylase [Rhodoferax sp.]|uniref:pyridoxal phosphate-dependent decarboxylase family protein n=1 Tax=Rhodoferax sp. TaxID=50421 RepID=UPI00273321C4|nr:pyridoxal-dependent decarboxylase [Rhodoferax sp.]MDP3190643.1 pyridoxal-dependent decarboxylase [Rhodoferax sp.]